MTRRTKPIGVLIATAICVTTAAGVSYAQERDTSEVRTDTSAMMGMGRMGGMTGMMNMMRAMIQGPDALLRHGEALGLSQVQVARLEALRDSVRAEARAVLTSEQREAFAGMARGMMGAGDSMTNMPMMMKMMRDCPMMGGAMHPDTMPARERR